MPEASPNVDTLLRILPKARLVDLGRQFGVAIAKPNGVPKEESVARLLGSGQLVFQELVEWMRCDELRQACRKLGVDTGGRSRRVLSDALLRAHGAASVPPRSILETRQTRAINRRLATSLTFEGASTSYRRCAHRWAAIRRRSSRRDPA